MGEECVFCKIVKGEIPVEKIYESENFLCFPDANPKVEGHCLIVSKKHFVNIMDLPDTLGSELAEVIKKVAEIKLRGGGEGFNLVMNNFPAAGQQVMHAHLHILPRKEKDGLHLKLGEKEV